MMLKYLIAPLLAFSSLVFAVEPVDINSADAAALAQALKGVGPAKAEAIVTFREKNGPFNSVDDLVLVQGIGEKTLEMNRDHIMVASPKAAR